MDLENLETFIKVAETKSFSRSAADLNLTQPAISKRIAALESRLETRLFDRAGRTVHLTEAGRVLLPGAKQIQSEVSRIEDVLRSKDEEIKGALNLGTTYCIANTKLGSLMAEFLAGYKSVEVDLTLAETEGVIESVGNNSLELALCPLFSRSVKALPSSLQCIALTSANLKIVASHDSPLAGLSSISLNQLTASKAILPTIGTLARKAIDTELASHGTDINSSVNADGFDTMKSLAAMGMGWTCLPPDMVCDKLVELNVADVNFTMTLSLVRHRDRTLSRAANAFLGTLPIRATNHQQVTTAVVA